MNILNKSGLLTTEDRKVPLVRGCEHFTFYTCLDLSKPVKMIPFGNAKLVSLNNYTNDIASFICWWTLMVRKDLNEFSGFHNIKFELVDCEIINSI